MGRVKTIHAAAGPAESLPARQAAGIQQLGDDLLGRVLLLLPQGQRSWAKLLRRPDMWATVEYPRNQLSYPRGAETHGGVGLDALQWLTSRSRATRSLRIQDEVLDENEFLDESCVGGKIQMLLLAFAAAPVLVDLRVHLPGNLSIDGNCMAHVKLLSGLTNLHIHGMSPPVTTDNLNCLFSALPALQACSLGFYKRLSRCARVDSKAGVPLAMFGCTQLTSLKVFDVAENTCLDWGGLSGDITALQQLAVLRLQNVLTARLTDAVSKLTNLTSLGLYSEGHRRNEYAPLLPAAAAALSSLRQLDVDEFTFPPALEALTGIHSLTLGNMQVTQADLTKLTAMRHLSRLCFCDCDGDFRGGKILEGLDGCTALQQLHIRCCNVERLSICKVLQRVTELRLKGNCCHMPALALVAAAMPQLVVLDLSRNHLRIEPGVLIEALQRCVSLRHLWFDQYMLGDVSQMDIDTADDLMEVQCAVPRVRWHLRHITSDDWFDEIRG